ncbi:hypothetical protein KCU64_g2, partial [Aureobasidium melanogenum]
MQKSLLKDIHINVEDHFATPANGKDLLANSAQSKRSDSPLPSTQFSKDFLRGKTHELRSAELQGDSFRLLIHTQP